MKLLMLRGLPASGKSTRAKELVESGNFVRVNRDLIRKMLHFGKWSEKNEGTVVVVEKAIVAGMLADGHNVVVDDCNLNPKNADMWKSVSEITCAKFETEFIDTPVEECVLRDLARRFIPGEDSVGRSVIMNMALEYGLLPAPTQGYVLCDLDGTLCNLDHRLHFVKVPDGEKKNWKSFFEGLSNDTVYNETADKLDSYKCDGYDIIFISARPEDYREQTEEWLSKNGFGYYQNLLMRRSGDRRDDVDVKRDLLNKYFKDRNLIYKVLDDRPRVIRMWRDEGLDVIDCGKGIEF